MLSVLLAGSVTLATTYTDNSMPSGNISTTTTNPVEFNISNSATSSHIISGNGTVTKNGDGTLTFSNMNNSYTGNVYINSGKVVLYGDVDTGDSYSCLGARVSGRTFYINNGATLNFADNENIETNLEDLHISFVIDGGNLSSGYFNPFFYTVFKNGAKVYASDGQSTWKSFRFYDVTVARNDDDSAASPVIFSSDLSKANATISFAYLRSAIEAGTSVSKIKVEEITSVNSSINDGVSDLVISAIIANPYERATGYKIEKAGVGTMEFTAPNTYTGPMTVSAGTLKFTDNAIVANGTVTVEDNATVEYNVSNGTTKLLTVASANKISGEGELVKTGDGTLQIYTAAAGLIQAESFVVSSGRLDMQKYFSGTLTVEDGAEFSPGNSIGTLEIDGAFNLDNYATLFMEIGGTDSNGNDILRVSGAATFEADSIVSFEVDSNSTYIPSIYDIVAVEMPEVDWDEVTFSSSKFYPIRYENGIQYLGVIVPEPSTWALLILGVAGLLYVRKRNNERR